MRPESERRILQAPESVRMQVVEGDTPPKIVGYAAVFNSVANIGGQFRERVMPGAFAATLAKDADVCALFNHNKDIVLGRQSAGTLTLAEDVRGLRFEIAPPDTQAGRDLMVSIKRGDITGASFGFYATQDSWLRDQSSNERVRHLDAVELLDVSITAFPAYSDATVGIRSQQAWRKAQGMTNLERATIIASI